ncbi:uncharacterized protein [Heterodontus francisci]|uniref:uncharacterized protein isoform X1 n=1 Tax=Heterodontus francisci TaxID=7792 RepID=UPI00355AF335
MATYFPKILCFIVLFFCLTVLANNTFTNVECNSPDTGIQNNRTVLFCEYKTQSAKVCNSTWFYAPLNTTNWMQVPCTSDKKRNAQKRKRCLTDLKTASLIIEKTKILDAGKYQIFLNCGSDGYDTMYVDLLVKAPYTVPQVTKRVQGIERGLSCTTLGYPLAKLYWQIENGTNLTANSIITQTEDLLYNITTYTSVIGEWCSVNYKCFVCIENECIYERLECPKSETIHQSLKRNTRTVDGVYLSLGLVTILALLVLFFTRFNMNADKALRRTWSTSTTANVKDDTA